MKLKFNGLNAALSFALVLTAFLMLTWNPKIGLQMVALLFGALTYNAFPWFEKKPIKPYPDIGWKK